MATINAEGTVFQLYITDALTAIAQVVSLGDITHLVSEVETTHLGSSAKTYRPGAIPEFGTISFSVLYDSGDTGHREMRGLMASPEVRQMKIILSDSSNLTFNGFLTEFTLGGFEDESNVTCDVTVRITGVVTYAES